MNKVTVDFEACKECGYCRIVCPKNVFEKGTEYNNRGYLAFVASGADECIGCRKCFYACPDFAISIEQKGRNAE